VPSESQNRSGNFLIYDITRFCFNVSGSQTENRWIISRKEVSVGEAINNVSQGMRCHSYDVCLEDAD
jgi:hypothetical protein